MENKTYEKCDHYWEDIGETQEYIGSSGYSNFLETDLTRHYKLVYIQRCRKCNKINKVD